MKKALLSLFAVAFITSMCFAEEASAPPSATVAPTQLPGSTTPPAPVETTTFTGKVDSILSGDSLSGAKPQITADDDRGLLTVFKVASDATIIGKDGKPITLNWIGTNDKVKIEYITIEDGNKTAKSIKVLAGG
jgi:hypothetical protein